MAFLTEPEPTRGAILPVLPGIARIVAPNPTVMTYHGTNTYLIDGEAGLSILDPGPDDATHVAAIIAAIAGRPVARILLSHTHHDHLGALPALQAAISAPSAAWHRSQEPSFTPDIPLHDGDEIDGWTALHTPGHASDHICLARADGVVFTADHIMSWSTSVVGPPHGDMSDYFASLRRMIARDDQTYLPGHGPPLHTPRPFTEDLLAHRTQRETAIEAALRETPNTTLGLVDRLYSQINPTLRRAAERNVIAHLHKLRAEGRAIEENETWRAA